MSKRSVWLGIILSVVIVLVSSVAVARSYNKDYDRGVWAAAVELGLIEGDASYYYDGEATPDEYYHALLTAILTVNEGRSHIPTTTTEPPTATTTTTVTTTTVLASTTTTVAPTTTTAPSGNVVNIPAGVHTGFGVSVTPNTTYQCADGAILDGDNTVRYAFSGTGDNVTIRGCEIRNYENPQQRGAIDSSGGNNWLVEDNEVHHNWGAGIALKGGSGHMVRNNHVHHQHQIGLKMVDLKNSVVEGNLVEYNNWLVDFSWGWEAGGSKFARTDGLITRGNTFRNNHGPGIWYDIANHNALIEDNEVHDNYANGIFYEISDTGHIRRNNVTGNGFGHNAWLWGSGILIATSSDNLIENNTVSGNYNGITVTFQNRDAYGVPYYALDNTFRNNIVSGGASGAVRDNGDNRIFERTYFYGNTYDTNHRFAWNNQWGNMQWWKEFHPNDAV